MADRIDSLGTMQEDAYGLLEKLVRTAGDVIIPDKSPDRMRENTF
jgi:hypothetical protein